MGQLGTPMKEWTATCPPDEILALWKACEANGDHFDVLVANINEKLSKNSMTATPWDVKKKCMDIRKGLNNAFERMKKKANEANDVAMMAELEKSRRNIPKNLTGMGSQRADYTAMLTGLSGSFGD